MPVPEEGQKTMEPWGCNSICPVRGKNNLVLVNLGPMRCAYILKSADEFLSGCLLNAYNALNVIVDTPETSG